MLGNTKGVRGRRDRKKRENSWNNCCWQEGDYKPWFSDGPEVFPQGQHAQLDSHHPSGIGIRGHLRQGFLHPHSHKISTCRNWSCRNQHCYMIIRSSMATVPGPQIRDSILTQPQQVAPGGIRLGSVGKRLGSLTIGYGS